MRSRSTGPTARRPRWRASSPPRPTSCAASVDVLAELVVDGEIAGVHLEGPWLGAGRCGAHDPAQLRDPDPAELDKLLATGRDRDGDAGPGAGRRAGGHPQGRRRGRGGRDRAHRRRLRPHPRGDRRGRPARHAPVQRDGPTAPPRARSRRRAARRRPRDRRAGHRRPARAPGAVGARRANRGHAAGWPP